MDSLKMAVKNIFKAKISDDSKNMNPNKTISVKEINSALSTLEGQNIECSDIVYRNKAKIKKVLKKLFNERMQEIKKKSYAVIDINKDKTLSLYYSMDANAFLNIAYSIAYQFELDINCSSQNLEDDNKDGMNNIKSNYLILRNQTPLKKIF